MELRPACRRPHEGDHNRDVLAQPWVRDVLGEPLVMPSLFGCAIVALAIGWCRMAEGRGHEAIGTQRSCVAPLLA